MTATQFRTVYVTAPSRDVALEIGRAMVQSRLAACANVLNEITSVYWWEGKLNEDAETVLLLKTHERHVAALTDAIKRIHPYDCPCIVSWPIASGYGPYLQWLEQETKPQP